jgi:hypothetical protein
LRRGGLAIALNVVLEGVVKGIIIIGIVWVSLLSVTAFVFHRGGKLSADRWYAQHWHANIRSNDVLEDTPKGLDDVTLIGHGITVVNASHVIVIQCNDETFSTSVALSTGQLLVCMDTPRFNWKEIHGGRNEH